MTSRLLLTLTPDHELLYVRLHIHQIGDRWAAVLLADEEPPPEAGVLKGLAFFGATPEEAEHAAELYLGSGAPVK